MGIAKNCEKLQISIPTMRLGLYLLQNWCWKGKSSGHFFEYFTRNLGLFFGMFTKICQNLHILAKFGKVFWGQGTIWWRVRLEPARIGWRRTPGEGECNFHQPVGTASNPAHYLQLIWACKLHSFIKVLFFCPWVVQLRTTFGQTFVKKLRRVQNDQGFQKTATGQPAFHFYIKKGTNPLPF